jgi:glycosyltransferase involved in cell wall biosynthesis
MEQDDVKIAIVAPSPVPFVIGGAENLWTGWLGALNALPGVEADLIKLPGAERNFWEIADSYRRFAALDLMHFDRVISTKYPAWMVAHPDHHVFLQHTLRGLYDTWPAHLDTRLPRGGDAPTVQRLVQALARARGSRAALPEIFAALDALRAEAEGLPAGLFALPGALIRLLVHGLDAIGLARGAVRRHAAISATVAGREGYFPADVAAEVEVIHHPTLPRTPAAQCEAVPEGAIFTASRLDGPKRMDWVVEAYRLAGIKLAELRQAEARPAAATAQAAPPALPPLVIAGDGPQHGKLAALAARAGDVRLVGRLTDAQLAAAYRKASFVPFVPAQEDYGLITLEALQAGKPVLSCADAGGVTELVRDGVNGLLTEASVPALAEGLYRLATDTALRERLAAQAQASVAHIDWPALARAFATPYARVVVVNTFPVYPPTSGGQLRLFHLYRALARNMEVCMVNLASPGAQAQARWLAPGLREVVVPMSAAHGRFERTLQRELRASCADMAAMLKPELSPAWRQALEAACTQADVVVCSHPYGWPAVRQVWHGPVVYEAHNVEVDLKAAIFGHARSALDTLAEVEGECAREAAAVLCCSAEDAQRMHTRYGLAQRPAVVANGVDAGSYVPPDAQARAQARQRLGLGQQSVALFVGSLHGPNVDAVLALLEVARACPEVLFCVLGSVCEAPALGATARPGNLRLVGRVSDEALRVWLRVADVGLNPVVSGSGTNLKLLEYAAAGLPALSTPFGGRGGILNAERDFAVAEIGDFAPALRQLLAASEADARTRRALTAREQALKAGDWRAIAKTLREALAGVIAASGY